MDVNTYIASDFFNNLLEKNTENIKFESQDKIKSDISLIAANAFNEGIHSIIQKQHSPITLGSFEKSEELTKLLPDFFVKNKIGQEAVKSILESIKMNQHEFILNFGYESLVKQDVENMIRIIYAIGVSTGFDIADDKDFKAMYIANKERFILHGSEQKPEQEENDK